MKAVGNHQMLEIATNGKARRDYHISETFEAGIELKGTEVKSIRLGKINLRDAFARVEGSQVFLYGCDIQPYEQASHEQHAAKRSRRLLLNKREIERLRGLSQIKGQALVALSSHWRNNRVKVVIGVGKGKTHSDQRQDLKKKDDQREMDREAMRFRKHGG